MARKTIRIDQYIGGWGYNKEMLRFDLKDTETDGAVIEIASLGGSLFDALHMHNQIAQHGNVEVVFVGPSASAATVLAMSAKKVSIVDNAFILIHKVMSMVDNFGTFNEDDLDTLIQDLQQLRTENQKFDLAIARIYSKRSGKSIEETIDVMKTGTWLDSKEAKAAGLVDAIVKPETKWNYYTERFVAMVRGNQLPDLPEFKSEIENPTSEIQNPKSEITNTMKQFSKINAALEVEELQATDEGCYLNEEQLGTIENRISETDSRIDQLSTELLASQGSVAAVEMERNTAISERDGLSTEIETLRNEHSTEMEGLNNQITELNAQVDTVTSERDTSAGDLSALRSLLSAIDPSVTGSDSEMVNSIRTLLSKAPGAKIPGTLDNKDKPVTAGSGEVDWETINKLPHNRKADINSR